MHSSYTDHYKYFESIKRHYKEENFKTFQSYISRHLKLEVIFSLKLINLGFVTNIRTFASNKSYSPMPEKSLVGEADE